MSLHCCLTVSVNIAYAVQQKHVQNQKIKNQVVFLLAKMEIADQGNKYPLELSGGQQQRMGLIRALVARSEVLLLDEPLTGLDEALKGRVIDFLSEWIAAYRPVVVWTTHEKIQLKDIPVGKSFYRFEEFRVLCSAFRVRVFLIREIVNKKKLILKVKYVYQY